MSKDEMGPDNLLDKVLSDIRAEAVDSEQVRKAGDRVWARVQQQTAASEPETLRTCADFQALIPAWREKRLSPARAMLFQDHINECPACRKALQGERVVEMRRKPAAYMPAWRWAVAAAVVAGIGLSAWLFSDLMVPGGTGARATVYAMDGPLYRVDGGAAVALALNAGIGEAERVRSSKDKGAVLRLRDASLVELAPRTELSISQRRQGVTIHLDRGAVIVQAAKQRNGHLFVATDDCTVSVVGTIFSVNQGVKGSRVSVLEGEVHVEHGDKTDVLHPGDQVTTAGTLTPVPLGDDFSWSRDPDKYIALMKDFQAIRAKVEALPGTSLRYSSNLIDRVPANAQFYAAIPNVGQTVLEINRIFREQMAQSPALASWWAERNKSGDGDAKMNEALDRIRAFSSYLGPEIVVALAPAADGKIEGPLVLAEVKSGFREYAAAEIQKAQAHVKLVTDLATATAGPEEILLWTDGNLAVIAKDAAQLRAAVAPAAGAFRATPFGTRVASAYHDGVNWLICADVQALTAAKADAGFKSSGFADLQYAVFERKDVSGKTENRVELSFSQPRQGVASWLAAPGPLRSLDFLSQDASAVAAFAIKDPKLAVDDVLRMAQSQVGGAASHFGEFESKTGLNVRNDVFGALGGEIAVALDGPVLPVPSIKVIAEVTDQAKFVNAVQKIIAAGNTEHPDSGVKLVQDQVNGRPYYTVTGPKQKFDVHFTFDNGYVVLAPTRDLVVRSVQARATGYSLPQSPKFRAMLPTDGHPNFSGVIYHTLGSVLEPLTKQALTPEQQKALSAIAAADQPTLVLLYGEQNRIELAARGSFFGMRLEQMLGLPGLGGPARMQHTMRH